jgi:hypothetical protein
MPEAPMPGPPIPGARGMARSMADIAPAHSAMTVCQDSRISGSAAIAESSLCHSVIQSCASLRGSGRSGATRARDSLPPGLSRSGPGALQSLESCPVLSRPVSTAMPHSSSSRAGP